jgi:hypothetical protein
MQRAAAVKALDAAVWLSACGRSIGLFPVLFGVGVIGASVKRFTIDGASSGFIHIKVPLHPFMRVEGGGEHVADPFRHSLDEAPRLP